MIVRELFGKLGFKYDEAAVRKFNNDIGAAKSLVNEMQGNILDAARGAQTFGRNLSMFVTLPILGAGAAAVKFGSDMVETQNKFDQVFKGMEKTANDWADNFAESLNRSETETKDNLAAFQSMALGLGAAQGEAFKMSSRLVQLAADFGSFNNLSDEESIQRFISAMSGSGEVLDRFGINIKQNALDLKLQQMGLAESTAKATELQKATARLAIIEESLGRQGAVGDAERTMGEFAAQLRQVGAQLKGVAEAFGELLVPAVNKVLGPLVKVLKAIKNTSPVFRGFVIVILGLVAVIPVLIFGLASLALAIYTIKGALVKASLAGLKFNLMLLFWPTLIIGIIALLGLLVDDIWNWVKGNDSAIGQVLGDWDIFIKAIGIMIGDLVGWFTGAIDKIKEFGKTLLDVGKKALNSPIGKILTAPARIAGGALGSAFGAISDFASQRYALASQDLATPGTALAAAGGQTNVNVNSRIAMTVPEGTPEAQRQALQTQAETAVATEWQKGLRQTATAFPRLD